MSQVNIQEAKTNLPRLLKRVTVGEEIVIARGRRPVARLVPYTPPVVERVPGTGKGEIWLSDELDAPLPDDVLDDFERVDLL